MRMTSNCASLVITVTTLVTLTLQTEGHTMHTSPVSRQYSMSRDFGYTAKDEGFEKTPYNYNAGGPFEVIARSKRLVDPDVLSAHGDGYFPMYYTPLAANGNYVEIDEIAKRHGVCGDPEKQHPGEATEDNTYSTETSNWPVIDSYITGEVLEIDVIIEAYHAGHLEFRICNTDELEDPGGIPLQSCFNKYQLNRTSDDGGASPIDPDYPGRYYVDPPCHGLDELPRIEKKEMTHWDGAFGFKARYQLPEGLSCEHCILQMHHITGFRCWPVGYEEFNPPSWPSECAPDKEDWIPTRHSVCGTRPSYPEEFWQCSDISIQSSGTVPTTSSTSTSETEGSATDDSITFATEESSSPTTEESMTSAREGPTPSPTEESTTPETEGSSSPTTEESTTDDAVEKAMCLGYTSSEADVRCVDLGCFKDSQKDRVLGNKFASYNMTTDNCFDYCVGLGASFMATQWGVECWCSNDESEILDHKRHGDGAVCDYECSGNQNEMCGGYDAFQLFYLDI